MEIYEIHISLDEGIARDMFPRMVPFLAKIKNKKELVHAVDRFIKRVSRGESPDRILAMDVAGEYVHLDYHDLTSFINKLVQAKELDKKYTISL